MKLLVLFLLYVGTCYGKIYFQEDFNDGKALSDGRWINSEFRGEEQGIFDVSKGTLSSDDDEEIGLRTTQDARFYAASAKFPESFTNKDKPLVIQLSVKHEQKIDCGGGYVKVYPEDVDQNKLQGESPYYIMFGPDICGYSTKKVHVIFNYEGKNLLMKKEVKCENDETSHLYTLILNPDNTFIVKVDNKEVEKGKLEDQWDFLLPKTIKDPAAKKPDDWVDQASIVNPEDTKPENWDQPEHIADPKAKRPEDWDDDLDGEWEAPKIDNPDFKGEWKPEMINNPDYKGPWVHPEIPNPEYKEDENLYLYDKIGAIGIDIWQVKSGSVFDNILVTDDVEEAEKQAIEKWLPRVEKEQAIVKERADAEAKENEAKKDEPEEVPEDDKKDEEIKEMPSDIDDDEEMDKQEDNDVESGNHDKSEL
ncbi:hypothetical protein SNEBB_005278 [Seison nebaliae]|nr:hypothetical protein SNEBB_005278 [Seison nebaliae]